MAESEILVGIDAPVVAPTVQGGEELEQWKQRQLRYVKLAVGIPAASLVMVFVLAGLGLGWLGLVFLLPAVAGFVTLPMSAVFLMRWHKANKMAEHVPQMPRAQLQSREPARRAGQAGKAPGRAS